MNERGITFCCTVAACPDPPQTPPLQHLTAVCMSNSIPTRNPHRKQTVLYFNESQEEASVAWRSPCYSMSHDMMLHSPLCTTDPSPGRAQEPPPPPPHPTLMCPAGSLWYDCGLELTTSQCQGGHSSTRTSHSQFSRYVITEDKIY